MPRTKASAKKVTKKTTTTRKVKVDHEFGGIMVLYRLPAVFLILCLSVMILLLFWILSPFATAIMVAAVFTIAFYPLYRRILKFFKGWSRIASLVSCILVVLVIVAPLTFFGFLVASEGAETYVLVQEQFESGVFDAYLQWEDGGIIFDTYEKFKEEVSSVVDLSELNLKDNIIELAKTTSGWLSDQAAAFVGSFFSFLVGFFIMLFSMFYFFKDGDKLVQRIGALSPLPTSHEVKLFSNIASMVKSIVFGVFFTAILQGVVGGIGFAIAGISSPVFWGTAMAFLSLLPVFGTAIIWVPAAIVLLMLGNYGAAIFIFLWGFLLVGSIDNLARPYLIGGKVRTYPLLMFFVILGGVWQMDFKGVVVGPLVLMILMSFLTIYETEYKKVLKR